MRGALFRRQLWLACALLALTSADGCDLNPQPLPPSASTPGGGFDEGEDAGAGPMNYSGSGSGSGSSSGGALGSSSGSSSGSGSGAPVTAPEGDAGATVAADAAVAEAGETEIDASTDAGAPV